MPRRLAIALAILLSALLAGCGGGDDDGGAGAGEEGPGRGANLREEVASATRSSAKDFMPTRGRTLQEIADAVGAKGPQVAMGTSVVTTGKSRLAFGVLDQGNNFVYGPTAVYIARGPDKPALGPFPAPADSLITDPPFRSQQAATEQDPFSAIYETEVPFAKPGEWAVLVVTKVEGQQVGAGSAVKVVRASEDEVVRVGERAPRVETDTLDSLRGDRELLDTREPPSDMHEQSLADVLGKKPVLLLFATPQLCQSRVCGPVTDIAYQLKQTYGDRMAFIHQEVFVDNDLQKGLRKPLQAFGLPTEPWLFTIDRDGRVAARLEGSFGFAATERAIKAALQ